MFPAREFARRFLAERNLILNASAVLWRRASLLAALDRCGDDLDGYRLAGDWRLYLELLAASTGRVVVVAAPLNVHRRHAGGVTGSLAPGRHVDEVARVHALARAVPRPAARDRAPAGGLSPAACAGPGARGVAGEQGRKARALPWTRQGREAPGPRYLSSGVQAGHCPLAGPGQSPGLPRFS